jgi:hypothetical protein
VSSTAWVARIETRALTETEVDLLKAHGLHDKSLQHRELGTEAAGRGDRCWTERQLVALDRRIRAYSSFAKDSGARSDPVARELGLLQNDSFHAVPVGLTFLVERVEYSVTAL